MNKFEKMWHLRIGTQNDRYFPSHLHLNLINIIK